MVDCLAMYFSHVYIGVAIECIYMYASNHKVQCDATVPYQPTREIQLTLNITCLQM